MTRHRSTIKPNEVLIADASVIINLVASGFAKQLLSAIPNRLCVVDEIVAELERGKSNGHKDAFELQELVSSNLVEIVSLTDKCWGVFEELVCGSAATTLDDGEAATLAYCVVNHTVPVIDERKANRICREKYSSLIPACSTDIFMQATTQPSINDSLISTALFNAIQHGRMRVMPPHMDWVIEKIGEDMVRHCSSLSKYARS